MTEVVEEDKDRVSDLPTFSKATAGRDKRRTRFSVSPNVKTSGVNFAVPARQSMAAYAVEKHGGDNWRVAVHHFFDQRWVQLTLMGLLIADILIIFTELFLQVEFPMCYIIERDCVACCPENDPGDARWLGGGGSYEPICEAGYDMTGQAGCDDYKWDTVHKVEKGLWILTLTILGIFLIENIVEMAALGPRKFFSQFFLALDFFIVSISFVLEIIYKEMEFKSLASMLILFRVWRFVRIGHGIVEVASELTHEQYEELIEFAKECDKLLLSKMIMPPNKSEKVEEILNEDSHH